jgi:outer membrane protein OmpA-like peptidoglycan-associated protein
MRRHFIFVFLSLFSLVATYGQESDCSTAIALKNNVRYTAQSVTGPGKTIEIRNKPVGGNWFTEEHNTIWYTFTSPTSGSLQLTLSPSDPGSDWDFMVFEFSENACKSISTAAIQPIRANLARNTGASNGKTGLSADAKNAFEVAGPNPVFSKTLEVKKDQRFIIVADNNSSGNQGHEILVNVVADTSQKEPAKEFPTIKQNPAPATPKSSAEKVNWSQFHFELFDAQTKEPLEGKIEIIIEKSGFGEDSIALFDAQSSISFSMAPETNFSINITKDGYLFISQNFRSRHVSETVKEAFFVPRAQAGQMISLPDINFKENTTHLLTSSINALRQINDFMVKNPKAVIEIRGHVNAPGYDNEGKVKRFSEKRAEEVKNFLVGMGIDGRRIKTAGMGNEQMLYPNPSNYQQEKANRRVEIVILED